MFVYEFPITVNVGHMIPKIGQIADIINQNMRELGFREQLVFASQIAVMTITTETELTQAQEGEIMREAQKGYDNIPKLKAANVLVGSTRRKSSQPGSQPTANK